ncbi:hypothetical protein D3H55_12375 [Bacillus salacetis]|uniref:DUF4268 domain-containing protein n=1 Tax=Bacillus salacetis TaxID=2315464 RepID=A0A3A1QXU1_9BACI|nr:hypothetical protein [Bacillus salacetis]RIW32675.1 hypothetical protein D3H55_12375 [Bacillus salacetis]
MSKNGSDKERIFSLSQLHQNAKVLTEVIGFKLHEIRLEKSFGTTKVDIYAIDPERKLEIFCECQVNSSDETHLQKILDLIDAMKEGIIVWCVLSFKDEHLKIVKDKVRNARQKYINFYAVKITEEIITKLEWLNRLYRLHVIENLGVLNHIERPLNLIDKIETIPTTFVGEAWLGERQYDTNKNDEVIEYMLNRFREIIPYYPNFYYEKKPQRYGPKIHIGAGISGVTYVCSLRSRRNVAYAEIHFDKSRKDLFEEFSLHLQAMQKYIHPALRIKDRKIGVYFRPFNSHDETIDQIGKILGKMIEYFSPYTFRGSR